MSRPSLKQLQDAIVNNRRMEVHALLDSGVSVNAQLPKDYTPFTLALSNHHWQLAEELLERRANPDQKINFYCSCLTWACLYQQRTLAEKLLELTTTVNASDYGGYTPLYWAVWTGSARLVDILLERGARVDAKKALSPLLLAAQRGNLEICRRLIAAGAPLDSCDHSGNSLLHAAVLSSRLSILELLLDYRPKLIDAVNKERQTALHLAAQTQLGDKAMLERLLAAGARADQRDRLGHTPIIVAAAYNTPDVLKALLATGADFSQPDRDIALKIAIQTENRDQVARLMEQFDLARPLDKHHPLRQAISLKHWSIVETLLRCGISPESFVEDGDPLLPWSVKQFLPELATLLVEAGATTGREKAALWLDNVMLMRKIGKVQLSPGSRPDDQPLGGHLLIALQKNIESLGFILTPELTERVLTLSDSELQDFYDLLIPCLRATIGADKEFKPMYPNFPRQVKEAPESELYLNAFLHYLGDVIGRRILPHYEKFVRPALTEKPQLKPIGLAEPDEARLLFRRLLEARGALTSQDKEALSWLVLSRGDAIAADLPEEVPFRENAALLAAALLRFTSLQHQAASYLKNGLDVLRTATAYCGGDVSLATNTRFGSFPKSRRRFFLAGLEADPNLEESLWRQPEKFKRLGEKLHPGEYRKRFPQTWKAFRQLRAGLKPATFGRQVEGYLAGSEVEACLPLLRSRPGEFARRLDHLLRLSRPEHAEAVLTAFRQVIDRIPTPLLLQLRKHFQSRDAAPSLRVFFPKGDLAKLKAIDNVLPPLAPEHCSRLEKLCHEALVAAYAERPHLGACRLDERLKNYTVPFALRSASKSLRTIARGSRIPFTSGEEESGPQETMRFFIWWRDGQSRTDLDLSALVLDGDFNFQTTLAYYNLKELGGYHSGDITSAPEGASEFIDIEVAAFLGREARYVMMVVSSYTTQPYCDLPECFAGFMHRSKPNSGEIYEPRTVVNKFDLTASTTIAIPLILDLHRREVIWTDLSLKRNPSSANNVHGNRSSLALLCEAMVSLNRPSLYELFELHIEARGQRVSPPEQAQTVFTAEATNNGVSPYDIPVILSEYL